MALSELLREVSWEKTSMAFEGIEAGEVRDVGWEIVALQNEIEVPRLHENEREWLRGGLEIADSATSTTPEGRAPEYIADSTP